VGGGRDEVVRRPAAHLQLYEVAQLFLDFVDFPGLSGL
jgi:hypothetical protein